MFYTTSDFHRGMKILLKNKPHEVIEFHYHKPGKGSSIVRTKIRNLLNNLIVSQTFRSGEKIARANIENKIVKFLHRTNKLCFFIEEETYNKFEVSNERIKKKIQFLKKNIFITLCIFDNIVINIILPKYIFLKVIECEPGKKGDTINNITKKATLETGFRCNVPSFININDVIKIDTNRHIYIGKHNNKTNLLT